MAKYQIEIIQQVAWVQTIEADSIMQATDIARERLCDGEWGKPSGWEHAEIENIELEV